MEDREQGNDVKEKHRPAQEDAPDVEGHKHRPRQDQGDERYEGDEPDVEGHTLKPKHRP